MAVTTTTIRLRFPEVASVTAYPDPLLQLKIDDSALYVGTDWGKWQDIAQSYLAMHFLWLSNLTAGGLDSANAVGPTSQETVGAVSHSTAVKSIDARDTNAGFYSNIYGQEFLRIRKIAFPFVAMVI